MMDGHSVAETVAWGMKEISRRWGSDLGDSSQSPVFIFAVGGCSGERELQTRLPFSVASEAAADPPLIAGLSNQLARLSGVAPHSDAARSSNGEISNSRVAAAIAAHGRLLKDLCRAWNAFEHDASWGITYTHLTAEHAHYLRILFPRAKFIALHRNPVEALKSQLAQAELAADGRYPDLTARFAEQWRRLAVSIDQTAAEVGALMINHNEAVSANCVKVEEYLGVRLLPIDVAGASATRQSESAELHAANMAIVLERVSGIASRLGYRLDELRHSEPQPTSEAQRSAPHVFAANCPSGASKCAVLVPALRYVEPECDEALMELERRGYKVMRMRGCSAIDHARSRMATQALEQGFEETLWVDADVSFDPDDVGLLRAHKLPLAAGIYARKRPRGGFAMSPVPGTREVTMGEGGGLVELLYVGTGFLLVRREVYMGIQQRFNLPLCDAHRASRAIPFFMPMLEEWGGQMSQLGEDYAFSRRAKLCGYKIMADTSIRLWHVGPYKYGYEDAAIEIERVASHRHVFE